MEVQELERMRRDEEMKKNKKKMKRLVTVEEK